MTTELPNLCDACVRYDGAAACTSFPEGIPEDILVWAHDHRQPIADELPFELDPAKRELYNQWLRFSPHARPAAA